MSANKDSTQVGPFHSCDTSTWPYASNVVKPFGITYSALAAQIPHGMAFDNAVNVRNAIDSLIGPGAIDDLRGRNGVFFRLSAVLEVTREWICATVLTMCDKLDFAWEMNLHLNEGGGEGGLLAELAHMMRVDGRLSAEEVKVATDGATHLIQIAEKVVQKEYAHQLGGKGRVYSLRPLCTFLLTSEVGNIQNAAV